jgi:hypothetical protein
MHVALWTWWSRVSAWLRCAIRCEELITNFGMNELTDEKRYGLDLLRYKLLNLGTELTSREIETRRFLKP